MKAEVNTFRRDVARTVSSNYIWPWLVLTAGCLFFGDVLVRRVALEFDWFFAAMAKVRDWLLQREPVAVPDQRMERLRSRKAAISQSIDERKASTRFEPEPDQPVDTSILDEQATTDPRSTPRTRTRSD